MADLGARQQALEEELARVTEAPGISRAAEPVLVLLKYPFYPLFILDNGMNLISKSLTVLTPA